MQPEPHSRRWYARLASTRGGYFYPWAQVLDGPSGEDLYSALLESLLSPSSRVLEAGCGHGPDAARYTSRVARWVGYDFTPSFLARARAEVPHAEFVDWHSGQEDVPDTLQPPFDLIVSRRGPTGVIDRLPELAARGATYLAIGPGGEDLARKVRERLGRVNLRPSAEWLTRAQGFLPTFQDYELYCGYNAAQPSREHWNENAADRGLPFAQERYLWMVRLP